MQAARPERLEARITREQKKLFQRAARLQGRTLTAFAINSIQEAAQKAIEVHTLLTLGSRDQEAFVEALLKSPKPSRRLVKGARRYKRLTE